MSDSAGDWDGADQIKSLGSLWTVPGSFPLRRVINFFCCPHAYHFTNGGYAGQMEHGQVMTLTVTD